MIRTTTTGRACVTCAGESVWVYGLPLGRQLVDANTTQQQQSTKCTGGTSICGSWLGWLWDDDGGIFVDWFRGHNLKHTAVAGTNFNFSFFSLTVVGRYFVVTAVL